MKDPTQASRLVDTKTLCQMFNLKEGTVRMLVSTGRLPSYKLGKMVRYDPDEVRALFEPRGLHESAQEGSTVAGPKARGTPIGGAR